MKRRIHGRVALALLVASLALVAGCGPSRATDDADFRGYVTGLQRLDQGDLIGRALIEVRVVLPDGSADYVDKVWASLKKETVILAQQDGTAQRHPATFGDLRVGQRVDVWYSGPVAESFPAQATAGQIVILAPGLADQLEGTVSAGDLLRNPVYGTPVRVFGEVSLLGDLLCPCFNLASGEVQLEVWYDLMVEGDQAPRPAVGVEGLQNGDWVVVTGELRESDGAALGRTFWAGAIEPIDMRVE